MFKGFENSFCAVPDVFNLHAGGFALPADVQNLVGVAFKRELVARSDDEFLSAGARIALGLATSPGAICSRNIRSASARVYAGAASGAASPSCAGLASCAGFAFFSR